MFTNPSPVEHVTGPGIPEMQIDATPNKPCRLPCCHAVPVWKGQAATFLPRNVHHGLRFNGFNGDSHILNEGPHYTSFHHASPGIIRLHQTSQAPDIPTSEIDSSEEILRLRGALSTLGGRLTNHRISDLPLVGSYRTHQSRSSRQTRQQCRPKRTSWLAFPGSPAKFRSV